MRVMTLYANEMGIETDRNTGKPLIDPETALQFVLEYCPWAARYEIVCGGIKCWESVDEHRRWCEQR